MSLINDMLRNIEAKRPDDLARHNLQREIRSLPPEIRQRRWPLLAGAMIVALGSGVLWLQANGGFPSLIGATPVETPRPIAAPPVAAAPSMSPEQDKVPVEPVIDQLRLSATLERIPLPATPVLPVPDPVVPPAPNVAPKVETPPAVPSGPVKIEKSPIAATPRDRADAEYRKAESAMASGRSAESLDGLRAAIKIDPTYVQLRQTLLRRLLDLRKVEEAMAVLQEGLDAQPAQTGWAMSLARLQLEQGDLVAADRTLARSQGYAEANADYAGFQGHLKSRLGAPRQAVTHYQRATRLAPNEGRWWLGLGLAQEADGHAAEAKEAFRRSQSTGTLSPELAAIAEQHLR